MGYVATRRGLRKTLPTWLVESQFGASSGAVDNMLVEG